MIALKTARRSRLQEDEEDSLLAGVDFQTHYLGYQEILLDSYDIDNVVQGIYSHYSTNEDINNSTLVAITVGPHQLDFFNVTKKEIEFRIETPDIKSIHCGGTRPKKYPNAVVLVTCVPQTSTKLHVIHCTDQRRAKKIYEAISRSFEYHQAPNGARGLLKKKPETDSGKFGKNNKIQSNSRDKQGKNKVSETEREPSPFRNGSKTGKVGFAEISGNITKNESVPDTARSKPRTKTSMQAKGVEGLGLLDNVDPEEGFDDEFTDFAQSRSASESFKLFGR